jgi:hypothetical protein
MAYIDPEKTWSPGEVVTAANLNAYLRDNVGFLANRPAVKAGRTLSNQNVPNSAETAASFDTERFDTDNMWVPGTPARITIQTAGVYLIVGMLRYDVSATGDREARLLLNGSNYLGQVKTRASSAGVAKMQVSALSKLAANDYVQLMAFQDSGAAVLLTTNNQDAIELSAVWQCFG